MIKRQGFVSNSSSSSFIVAFPKKAIETKEELYNLMSPGHDTDLDMDESYNLVDSWYQNENDKHSDYDVVYRVFQDMGRVITLEEATEAVANGLWDTGAWDKFRNIEDWTERSKLMLEYNMKHPDCTTRINRLVNEAIKQYGENNYQFFKFGYADDSGEGWLEHSGIFDNMPYHRISHH